MTRIHARGTELPLAHIERAKYLWEEFKYRHDLIWQLAFRVTTVAGLLSLVPFVVDDAVTKKVGPLLMVGPVLAFVLVCSSRLCCVRSSGVQGTLDR
jgi:hypothetical protein